MIGALIRGRRGARVEKSARAKNIDVDVLLRERHGAAVVHHAANVDAPCDARAHVYTYGVRTRVGLSMIRLLRCA